MKIGYIIASNEVMIAGRPIGYLYREEPDNENDSGWRVFSGEETQESADEASTFAMYNATTVLEKEPAIAAFLGCEYPVTFERDAETGEFVEVEDEPKEH
jgi:hypothetical protein